MNISSNQKPHSEVMAALADRHGVIASLIDNRPVHYVDVPVHPNVGDLLIMLGTEKFFEQEKISVELRAPFFAYSKNWVKKNNVIVFQGGGNFGDLYRGPQDLRERIISSIRNRIIILPQTIHFTSQEKKNKCVELLRQHPDLHIFVRDRLSFETAQQMTKNVYLAPDMAHNLWRTKEFDGRHAQRSRVGTLLFRRTDGEACGDDGNSPAAQKTDWPDLVGAAPRALIRTGHHSIRLMHSLGVNKPFLMAEMQAWKNIAERLSDRARRVFEGKKEVVTDRLHGHILACLLEVPNTVSDNSYGKNFSYIREWTGISDIVRSGAVPAN